MYTQSTDILLPGRVDTQSANIWSFGIVYTHCANILSLESVYTQSSNIWSSWKNANKQACDLSLLILLTVLIFYHFIHDGVHPNLACCAVRPQPRRDG